MLSPQANLRLLDRTSWGGLVYIAFLMVGIWPLAGFVPSQPPSWNAGFDRCRTPRSNSEAVRRAS